MGKPVATPPAITPRLHLDFQLDAEIPRHWFGGDPFKTRLFDAMSLTFPEGERFFIACVRDYCVHIEDQAFLTDVLHFSQQEAQHRRVHLEFNQRLARQGVKVDKIEATQRHFLFEVLRKHLPSRQTLAMTTAAEHLTAIMAHNLLGHPEAFRHADPRVRAMLAWHAIEEIEHKGVAFDVLQRTAKAGYAMRTLALIEVTLSYAFQVAQIMNHMFKVDGCSRWQRYRLWARGLVWLWGPRGLFLPMIGPWLAWFKPGYHPWQSAPEPNFERWSLHWQRNGDPIAASNALIEPACAATTSAAT